MVSDIDFNKGCGKNLKGVYGVWLVSNGKWSHVASEQYNKVNEHDDWICGITSDYWWCYTICPDCAITKLFLEW
jgi:hypothetical protein